MRTFNELNEAYERTMMARTEPERKTRMKKPRDAEIYDWDQFVECAEESGIDLTNEVDPIGLLKSRPLELLWDFWKEGYTAGVESTVEDDDEADE